MSIFAAIYVQTEKSSYTEQELVSSLQNKDEQAFAYLYDNYAGALNGVIMNLVNDVVLAEDILQEVFVKIWNNIVNYDSNKGRLYTWLRTVANNYTLDVLKSKAYKQQRKVTDDEQGAAHVYTASIAHERLNSLDLQQKLNTLDEKQRLIIDLSYFKGYTQEEIAQALAMPLGTVKSKVRAAIIELRKIMN